MNNKIIVSKVKIKDIDYIEVKNSYNYSNNVNNNHVKVELLTNCLDVYTGKSIPKEINVIFNFNYDNYRDAFEKIFLPYIGIDSNGQYLVNNIIGKDFLAVLHLKYNEFYDCEYYLIKSLISLEHVRLLLDNEKVGSSNE